MVVFLLYSVSDTKLSNEKFFKKHLIHFEKIQNGSEKNLMRFEISKDLKHGGSAVKKYIKIYNFFW